MFLMKCGLPMGLESSWEDFYPVLLEITKQLCLANAYCLTESRNLVDCTDTTLLELLPDYTLQYNGLVLLREERSVATTIQETRLQLTEKMRCWNPMFYGDLPYTLGYVTSAQEMEIVAIDKTLRMHSILRFRSIVLQKAEVLMTFYNLAFVFVEMVNISRHTRSKLLPFIPMHNEKQTLMLMDDRVRRTIAREQCEDASELDRLIDVYTKLQELSQLCVRTHLQTVEKLSLPTPENPRLFVELSPLGIERRPTSVNEVRDMVRVVQWRNIVRVPEEDTGGYWVLIDMDESREPNTTKITWRHQCHGEMLTFHHDLYQLVKLMNGLQIHLPDELKQVQDALLSPDEQTAEDLLSMLG